MNSGIKADDQKRSVQEKEVEESVENTRFFEQKYVHGVYNAIAPHFSSTRFSRWPRVSRFLEDLPLGSVVLDAGCGNGKYLGTRTDVFSFGTDRSDGLLGICRAKNFEVALGDALNLPVRAESVDSVICIAVIHHLASEERRKEAIREMSRVLRKGGTMLIYVWSFEARSKGRNTQKLNGQEAYVSWKMPKRFRGKNTEAVQDTGDLEVMRYYHLFKEGELERLVLESFSAQGQNSLFIEQSGFDHENWFIIAKKT